MPSVTKTTSSTEVAKRGRKRKTKEEDASVSETGPSSSSSAAGETKKARASQKQKASAAPVPDADPPRKEKFRPFPNQPMRIHSEDVAGGRKFAVLGSTGNVYDVVIQEVPTCTCPDSAKGNLCKHVLFVLLKVLKLSSTDERVWQKALLPSEVRAMLSARPIVGSSELAEARVRQKYMELTKGDAKAGKASAADKKEEDEETSSTGVKRRTMVDEDCPICCEPLDGQKKEEIVWCRTTCGGNLHKECFQMWARGKHQVTCPLCRALWVDAGCSSSNDDNAGGYTNLAAFSSTAYEPSTYNPEAWRSRYYD